MKRPGVGAFVARMKEIGSTPRYQDHHFTMADLVGVARAMATHCDECGEGGRYEVAEYVVSEYLAKKTKGE